MASMQPAHGGNAQTKEFDIDLVAEGISGHRGPNHALAVVSVDANVALRAEISAANEYDWQLDARIVDSSVEVGRIFCEGDSVHDDDVPAWVDLLVREHGYDGAEAELQRRFQNPEHQQRAKAGLAVLRRDQS